MISGFVCSPTPCMSQVGKLVSVAILPLFTQRECDVLLLLSISCPTLNVARGEDDMTQRRNGSFIYQFIQKRKLR